MKKGITVLLTIAFVFSIFMTGCASQRTVTSSEDNSLKEIEDKGTFVVGLDDTFAPMGFKDESGEIVGFDVDLAKEVAERMDVELELKSIDWDAKEMELNNKNIDAIWNGLTITQERKEKISFSEPYLENKQIIIVKSDSDIANKADLAGKVVGVQLDSSAQGAVEAEEEVFDGLKELRKLPDNMLVLTDVGIGRIDAAVMDEIMGRYYIEKKPGEYKVLEDNFGDEEYGVGFRKGDLALVEKVNSIMKEMKEDGTAAEISKKWFGEDIVVK